MKSLVMTIPGFCFLLVFLGSVGGSAGCVGTESSPAGRTAAPVPGTRASQWDPCDREDEFGQSCVRDGDTCPGGGNRPARFQCRFGTWRCVIDTTRSCGEAADAGPVVQDAGVADAAVSDTGPVEDAAPPADVPSVPAAHVNVCCYAGPGGMGSALTNTVAFRPHRFVIEAVGRSVEFRHVRAQMNAVPEFGGRVASQGGSDYFRNYRIRLYDGRGTGETVMGPAVQSVVMDRRQGNVLFRGSVFISANQEREFDVVVDTAAHEEQRGDFVFAQYALRLDVNPDGNMFYADDLIWTDTRTPVRSEEISYSAGCFVPGRFRVQSRYARVILDLDRSAYASAGVPADGDMHALLPMSAVNDGANDGIVTEIPLTVYVPRLGADQPTLQMFATSCSLFGRDGTLHGVASVNGNAVHFRGLRIRVPGNGGRVHFEAQCRYRIPSGTGWNHIVLRAGVPYNHVTGESTVDPGTFEGTLDLDQNWMPANASAVTVTISQP